MRVSAPPNSSRSCSTSAGSSDVSTSCAISAERSGDGTSRRNASSSAGPDSPGSARGMTSTTRHSSGIGWCASSGAGRSTSRRTPPSTTRPPSANVHVPTAERAARPTASASSGASTVAIVERRQRLRDRERELRARPQPDVRRDRLDHAQVRAAREPERLAAAAREGQRALGVGALGGQLVGRPSPRPRRRAGRPTPRARRSAAGRRRPPRASRGAGAPAPRRAPALTALPPPRAGGRVTYAIASRSRGPAVLSTSGCRRLSSARMSSAPAGAPETRGSTPRAPRGAPG